MVMRPRIIKYQYESARQTSTTGNSSHYEASAVINHRKVVPMVEFYLYGVRYIKPYSWAGDLRAARIEYNLINR